MVEGDGCHRVAREHRKSLVGRKFVAKSPNGRFKAGARAIVKAGGVLLRIEVHGKNLFYFFGKSSGRPTVVVRIHFGMAGAFAVYKRDAPETTDNTRLLLESKDGQPHLEAHLSAMTVEHGEVDKLYNSVVAKLGPDPLREDADPSSFFVKCAAQKKPIGAALMDQSMMAGVGNIYRSESLYESRIHPSQPSNTVTLGEHRRLWAVIVKQMQAGFKSGSIWGKKKGPSVYGLTKSACGGKVKEWDMGGRTVYACGKQQRLDMKRPVVSADGMVSLKHKTGIAHIGRIVPAALAEKRKRKTGEGLGVQHVALKDDATLRGALRAKRSLGGSRRSTRSSMPPMKKRRT